MQTETTSNLTKTKKTEDGFVLGQSATDLVGLHGVTPIAQATVALLAGTLTGSVDGTIADVPAAVAAAGEATAADLTTTNVAITSINLQLKELQTKLNAVIQANANKGLTKLA